jgi:hypothetical protein
MFFVFDIDDTITEYPEVLSEVMKSLKQAGHKVFCLTGNGRGDSDYEVDSAERVNQLKKYGVQKGVDYDSVVACNSDDPKEIAVKKGEWCKQNNVDLVIDDMDAYIKEIKRASPNIVALHLI